MKRKIEKPLPKKIGWAILAGVSFLFFLACRILLFFPPDGENFRLFLGTCIYIAWFLYAVFYGMLAWHTTERVLLPALALVGFVTLTSFSDPSGILDAVQNVTRPFGYTLPLLLYFWKALRFGVVAAAVGGMIKNIRG